MYAIRSYYDLKEIAKYYNLVTTGGSTFHGFYGEPEEELGSSDPGLYSIIKLKEKKKRYEYVHN